MSTYVPPGGYVVPVEAENDPEIELAANVRRPPEPGAEVAGPALVPLVQELGLYRQAMEALAAQARATARIRYHRFSGGFQLDNTGAGASVLFSVPQGATGYLMHLALDEAGKTPSNPDTSANLFHGIYSTSGAGTTPTVAQLTALGQLLDCNPQSPSPDAQIPFVYLYGSREAAPVLVGPQTYYIVVSGGTASVQCWARGGVLVDQPEP